MMGATSKQINFNLIIPQHQAEQEFIANKVFNKLIAHRQQESNPAPRYPCGQAVAILPTWDCLLPARHYSCRSKSI